MRHIEKVSRLSAFAAVALAAGMAGAAECDWKVVSDTVDPINDQRVCIIRSDAAGIALAARDDGITFLTGSAYSRDYLELRVDENPSIRLGDSRSTKSYGDHARRAVTEIRKGQRLRTSYRDYPSDKAGDAPICNLPALLDACSTPKPE